MSPMVSLCATVAAAAALSLGAYSRATVPVEPQLFMAHEDARDPRGLILARSTTVQASSDFLPLPRARAKGQQPLHPLAAFQDDLAGSEFFGTNDSGVYRWTSRDLRNYTAPRLVHATPMPTCPPAPAKCRQPAWIPKTIAKNTDAGVGYVMLMALAHPTPDILVVTVSFISPDGLSWQNRSDWCHSLPQTDDMNLVFHSGLFVNIQKVIQNHTCSTCYCDNLGPCGGAPLGDPALRANDTSRGSERRVFAIFTSPDGQEWTQRPGLLAPDAEDPPDLQFYQVRPFVLGGSGRLAARALMYAPDPVAPNEAAAHRRASGLSHMCVHNFSTEPLTVTKICHGPHVMNTWWVLAGEGEGQATVVSDWRRPVESRWMAAAPPGPTSSMMMAAPVTSSDGQSHVWIDTEVVYTLPLFRLAGLWSPTNAEVSSAPFSLPPGVQLWINADAKWAGLTWSSSYDGSTACDVGCAAYVMAEMRYANGPLKDTVVPGHERSGCVLQNVDGLKLPLQWSGAPPYKPASRFEKVYLRLFFRDATIFAIGGDAKAPLPSP